MRTAKLNILKIPTKPSKKKKKSEMCLKWPSCLITVNVTTKLDTRCPFVSVDLNIIQEITLLMSRVLSHNYVTHVHLHRVEELASPSLYRNAEATSVHTHFYGLGVRCLWLNISQRPLSWQFFQKAKQIIVLQKQSKWHGRKEVREHGLKHSGGPIPVWCCFVFEIISHLRIF